MLLDTNSIITESDVEQKIIYPLLTNILKYSSNEIKTKEYMAPTVIDKGAGKKSGYYPDYVIYLGGLPSIVIEAKDPNTSSETGYREARLYSIELNKLYPEGVNPVQYILSCNGVDLLLSKWDSEQNISRYAISDMLVGSSILNDLTSIVGRDNLIQEVNNIRHKLIPVNRMKPLSLIGGSSRQSEEVPSNSFATDLLPLLRKYFDADETKWSPIILERAYCSSDEVTQYNATLETLLKDKVSVKLGFNDLETTKKDATEFTQALKNAVNGKKATSDPLILIIGNVGSGKSMFIERYYHHLIDSEIKNNTKWAFVDFNNASDDLSSIDSWICSTVISSFRDTNSDDSFYDYENLRRYFAPDIMTRDRGPYKILKETDASEYNKRITDYITAWFDDPIKLCAGILRYYSKDRSCPVVIVFDNIDRRDREQQLKIFQTVQWFKAKHNIFAILALRDETYDAYKNEPPLDAFMNPFAFRIIPPRFITVVKKRLELLIEYLANNADNTLTYTLTNGMVVKYPSNKLGIYLFSMYLSIFKPSRKIGFILEAFSGKNIRKALEMFAEILISGHLREDLIMSITEGGKNEIPEWLIIRILMRTNHKYYSDNHGYISNVYSLPEQSSTSNNFMILEILEFLAIRRKEKSNYKLEGYFYVPDIINYLSKLGLLYEDVMWALEKLLGRGLIVADHQRTKNISPDDYVKITASGYYHLRFLTAREEYVSNACIDTWLPSVDIAKKISNISNDTKKHRLDRLKLFYECLLYDYNRLTANIPEYINYEEISNKQVSTIKHLIDTFDAKRSHDTDVSLFD